MAIDPTKLWKAWPAGYLAARGVLTVAGWHCWAIEPWGARAYNGPVWVNPDGVFFDGDIDGDAANPFDQVGDGFASTNFRQAVEAGDLLPNVDPSDVATWACLLRDLAAAEQVGRKARQLARKAALDTGQPAIDYFTSLAKAGSGNLTTTEAVYMLGWRRTEDGWRLRGYLHESRCGCGAVHELHFDGMAHNIDTDNPAEALVLARIQLCEAANVG